MTSFNISSHRWHQAVVAAVFTCALAGAATAAPIAAVGSEGLSVIATGGEILATFEGNTGSFTAILYLGSDVTELFNNHLTEIGKVISLGSFAAGTELVFRMHVNDTGDDFYTGPADRNADQTAHARAQAEWQLGTTLVSFEDLRGVPEGAFGYNDMSFSLKGVSVSAVPEPSGLLLAMGGVAALTGLQGKRRLARKGR